MSPVITLPDAISDPALRVVPYAARYQTLCARLGLDLPHILTVLNHLPLAQDGARHRALRADVARYLGPSRRDLQAALPGLTARHLAPLTRPGPLELMGQVIVPYADACLSVLIGTPVALPPDSLISRVFSEKLGVARRRRMNAELDRMRAQLATLGADDLDTRVTLAVLGRDALIGALAGSLAAHFAGLDGAAVQTKPFDPVPTHTGVPFVDRVPRDDPAGPVQRCPLAALTGHSAAARMGFFGAGAHACLGRAATLDIFASVAAELAHLQTRITVQTLTRRDDDVFDVPDRFEVTIC